MNEQPRLMDAGTLADVSITRELARRPAREPDLRAESRVLAELAHVQAAKPETLLQRLAELARPLVHADSMGISLCEPAGPTGLFRWHATAGEFAGHRWLTLPRNATPCGVVVEQASVLLFREPTRWFPELGTLEPGITEGLYAPIRVQDRTFGTIWALAHTPGPRFDHEDARLLALLSHFAASAQVLVERTRAVTELRAERIAALNLMEDAIAARAEAEEATTALQRSEARQEFLLRLSDTLRPISDPIEIQQQACQLLGEHLQVNRVNCAEIANEEFTFLPGYAQDVRPAAGRTPIIIFGERLLETYRRGEPVTVADVGAEPCFTEPERTALRSLGIAAFAIVILMKDDRWAGALHAHSKQLRAWDQGETDLMREVAERIWDAMERARVQTALRTNQERTSRVLSIQTVGVLFFRLDGTIQDANHAFEQMSGYTREQLRAVTDWTLLTPPEFASVTTQAAADLALRGETAPYEKQMIRRDGSRWWGLFAPTRLAGAGRESECVEFIVDITEQKRAAEALQNSEEQFRRAIEEAPIPVVMFTEHGQVLQVSRTWCQLTGYGASEIQDLDTWLNQAYGAGAHQVRDMIRELFVGSRLTLELEVPIRTRADEMRYWRLSASSPGVLRDGRRFIVGMAVDLTERQSWERALRESEERFRLLVQSVQDHAIVLMDPAGLIMSWNEGAQRILGYRAEEILGRPGATFFQEEDLAKGMAERELSTAAETGLAMDENWLVRKDGSRFWASGATTALRDESGSLSGFAKIFRDLTERKAAEDALREKEARLRIALSAARMGTWLWDLVSRWHMLDESLHRLLGDPPHPITTLEEMLALIHPDDREKVTRAFERSVEDGTPLNVEFRVPLPDGTTRWLNDQGELFRDPDGRPLYMAGACVDITERKQAEQALRENHTRLELALEGAQAAARAKDQFLAALSHELRTPLMPVMLTVSMLQEEKSLPRELREDIAMIRRNIETEARMVDDLLDLSRIMNHKLQLERQPVDAHDVLRRALEVCLPAAGSKSITIRRSLRARHTTIQADADRLQQVFWNILQNAVKFTPEGGKVAVHTTNPSPDRLRIDFRDTGRGIDPALLAGIFEPFEQAGRKSKESLQGLGLGLTIARRIVEAHEGELFASSAGDNRGATFSVVLQLASPERPPTRSRGSDPRVARRHGNRTRADHRQRRVTD